MENSLLRQSPLAERLRPTKLKNFVGQTHLRESLQNLADAPRLSSLLLFGPPGCGKSSLALLLAHSHGGRVLRLSAPEAGLQQLRRQLAGVDILVLDELHRFSKAQQDFFLPLLENGDLVMIATTTENPSFSVTRQLLSRLYVLRLNPLATSDLLLLAKRGTQELGVALEDAILEFLAGAARGDARNLLNLVEFVAALPKEKQTLQQLRRSLPEIMAQNDKDTDTHYEYASALIKSIRGSDPDAALYYLACMLEGGEDPRFICRRLIISASEDVGLADPSALPMAVACQQAVEFVGMPEGRIPLAETTVYLALARKSNSTYVAFESAAHEVKTNGSQPVPLHLRNATTSLQREWGYGKEYKYPHNFPQAWVDQEYLPEQVKNRVFYVAKDLGEEPRLSHWHKQLQNNKAEFSALKEKDDYRQIADHDRGVISD